MLRSAVYIILTHSTVPLTHIDTKLNLLLWNIQPYYIHQAQLLTNTDTDYDRKQERERCEKLGNTVLEQYKSSTIFYVPRPPYRALAIRPFAQCSVKSADLSSRNYEYSSVTPYFNT